MDWIAMRRKALAFAVLGALVVAIMPGAWAAANEARIVALTTSSTLQVKRPDFPVPSDPGQVFYMQRSTNANTVIYAARFDASGKLDPANPVEVYWRRYDEGGQQRELNLIERQLAYGVRTRARAQEGDFTVTFRALPGMPLLLRQIAPFDARLYGAADGRSARLIYGYVEVDERGLIPRAERIHLQGVYLDSGEFVSAVMTPVE